MKCLVISVAFFTLVCLIGSAFAYQSCNDQGLEQEIVRMYDDGPYGRSGFHIIDFTDEIATSDLPGNAEGTVILSCEANIELNNTTYDHILYDVEVHEDGKIFTGYQLYPGRYTDSPASPMRLIPNAPIAPSATPISIPTAPVSSLFTQGLADRTAWEQWVGGLSSDFETGARYWAGQRSLPRPGSCTGVPAFTAGCEAARARLTPTDIMRKSYPEYRAGWNSYRN
jgi:hypothetical protein